MHAGGVYADRRADLLAAAITYFGFLAIFPVLLLAVSVAGFVLAGRPELFLEVTGLIRRVVPGDVGDQLVSGVIGARDARGTVGLIGLVGLLYAGVSWMTNLRIAIQTIWRGHATEPDFLADLRQNLAGLFGLGAAVLASVTLTALATGLTDLVIDVVGLSDVPGIGVATGTLGLAIALGGDVLIFCWLFVNLPREALPYRVVLRGALFASVGFELLKLLATFYLRVLSDSPAAVAFGTAIGLVVWIYLVSRFLLFAAAWTVTSSPVRARLGPERDREPEPEPRPAPEQRATPEPQAQASPERGVGAAARGPGSTAIAGGLLGLGVVLGATAGALLRRQGRARHRSGH